MSAAQELYFHRRNSCERKIAFPTWDAAEAACLAMRHRHDYRASDNGLLAYKCIYGDHWHIGNSSHRARNKAYRARRLIGEAPR